MNRNPFLTLLINYWESLFVKYDDKVELITRVIARAIVVVFLACLTPTVGVLLSIFYTFDGMLVATYKKLKEIKDEEGKFPVLIELAIYFILWLPFVLVYLPLLLLKSILLGCVNNLWVPIVLTVVLAGGYFYYMGFGNKASVVNTEVNSVRSSSDFVSSDNVNMELSHIEHTTSEESLNLSASNAKSLENDSIGDNKLTESFSESNAEMLDEIYDPEDEQVEEEQTVEEEPTVEKQAEEDQEDEIFERVEKAPTFPGGQGAMVEFLSKNIKYPADCQRSGIQGRVIVSFVVNKDGTIQNVEVIRSVHKSLDAEAVRVVKSMPAWSPGEQQGSKVRSKFQLPVFFRLANK